MARFLTPRDDKIFMFTLHKLPNGLRIILAPKHETKAVSLLVLVKVGSRSEIAAQSGLAHFLEHLMFKGTKRRPNTQIISQELDAIGAEYNAYTAKDHTAYYIKASSAHLELVADMLADMLTESIFAPEEVERERGTILEEINMYEDNPMAKVGDLFEEDLFGKNTPLGRHVIGAPGRIKSITQPQIVAFWRKHYQAANLVMALSGSFNKTKALALLKNKFGKIKRGRLNRVKAVPRFGQSSKLAAHHKDTNQAHLVLGFPGVSYTDRDREAISLLSIILGGNMSSRLFINVRERLGLCYFIRAGLETYEDAGAFIIQAGLDLTKVDKALAAISRELKDIKVNGVKDAELNKAKQFVKGKTDLSLEESLDVASFLGKQALFYKKIQTPEQALAKVRAVKTGDIQRLANVILDKRRLHIVTLAPFKDINKFARFVDI